MTDREIHEFFTKLHNGELDNLVDELETIVRERQYARRIEHAKDKLDRINIEIDRYPTHPQPDDYRRAITLYNRLRQWKRENGNDHPRLQTTAERLLKTCFSCDLTVNDFNPAITQISKENANG